MVYIKIKCKICNEMKYVFRSSCIICNSPRCKYVLSRLRTTENIKKNNPLSIFNFMEEKQIIQHYKNIYDTKKRII